MSILPVWRHGSVLKYVGAFVAWTLISSVASAQLSIPNETGPDVSQRPMPGSAEVPFSLDEQSQAEPEAAGVDSYNYSTGGAAPIFEAPAFEEYQAGATEEEGPGAFRNTKYRWYGFVRLDGIYDFKPIASTDSFVTSSIPVPQGEGDNVVLTPRVYTLGLGHVH